MATTSHQLELLQIIANLRSEVPKNSATFGLSPKEAATAAASTNTRNKAHFKETPMSSNQITQIPTIGRLLTHMKTNIVSK